MKSSDPQRSSDRGRLLLLAVIAAGAIVLAMLMRHPLALIVWPVAVLGIDYAAWRVLGRRAESELNATLRHARSGAAMIVDGETDLHCSVKVNRRIGRVEFAPILPGGFEPVGNVGVTGHPNDSVVDWTARIRPERVGAVTLPGLIARMRSPLGTFTRSILLPAPCRVIVLPDYAASGRADITRSLRYLTRIGSRSRQRVRGMGSDFAELRSYRPSDLVTRIDWKATARRQSLIVREFEEPRELIVRVLLDRSVEMTHERADGVQGVRHVLALLGRIALATSASGVSLELRTVDTGGVGRWTFHGGATDAERVVMLLATLPREALRRKLLDLERFEKGIVKRVLTQGLSTWEMQVKVGRSALLDAWRAAPDGAGAMPVDPAVDLAPDRIVRLPLRSERCGHEMYPSDVVCRTCGTNCGGGAMSPRAAAVLSAFASMVRQTHGREIVIFLSSLEGGETHPTIATLLARSARPWRDVHVVIPAARDLSSARQDVPIVMHRLDRKRLYNNVDRLRAAAAYEDFRNRLEQAGIHVHSLDDPDDLDDIVERLLVAELHAV